MLCTLTSVNELFLGINVNELVMVPMHFLMELLLFCINLDAAKLRLKHCHCSFCVIHLIRHFA